jgi:hypothetical protein
MTEADEDDWDDSKEEAWCLSIRPKVIDFLTCQHVTHGQVGELPAWHVVPYVSVWAIESAKAPGWVGWWVICGDLPTSICSAHECRHPRLAVRRFAETWKQALAETLPDAPTIGTLRIPAKFASLLAARSELLIEFANNDGLWPDELYG